MRVQSFSFLYVSIAGACAIALANVLLATLLIHRTARIEIDGLPKPVMARVGGLTDAYVDATSRHFLSLLLSWHSASRSLRIVEASKILSPAMRTQMTKWILKYYPALEWFDKNQAFHIDDTSVTRITDDKWRVTATGNVTSYYGGLGEETKPMVAELVMRRVDANGVNPFLVNVTALSIH